MATTLTSKPLDFFKPDPGNPRKSFDNENCGSCMIRWARSSWCRCWPSRTAPSSTAGGGGGAAKLDGKPERLDVIITDEPLTPAQIKEIQLVTALHRADLKPYEQFLGCRDWLALNPGATAKDLAAKIDRDPSTLVRILSLSKCIQPVQQAAADGKLGPSEWYAISKVPEAEQQAMLAAKLAGASRDQLEQRGRKLRNGEAHGIKVNRLKIPLGPQGRSVTIAGSNLSLDDAIEILQDALEIRPQGPGREPRRQNLGAGHEAKGEGESLRR